MMIREEKQTTPLRQLPEPLRPFTAFWQMFPRATRLWLVTWFGAMTAVPIAIWVAGPETTSTTMLLATIFQGLLVGSLLSHAWGWRRALLTAAGVALIGWGAEFMGTHTGFPFGAYDYTSRLQPQIGHVPLLVPLAWFMMLPVGWAVAERLTGGRRGWLFVLASAGAMTAWDLYLDPQMVAWRFWLWRDVPAFSYFGIPWQNYAGWLLTSATMTVAVRPLRLGVFTRPLLAIYGLTWLLQAGGLFFFWNLQGPAIAGFVVMGGFFLLALKKEVMGSG